MYRLAKNLVLFISINLLLANGSLSLSDNGDGTFDVDYISDSDIGGFQFSISEVELFNGVGTGGLAELNGITVSTGPNGVLGLSFTWSIIPPTSEESTLTTIQYNNPTGDSICIPSNSLIISDSCVKILKLIFISPKSFFIDLSIPFTANFSKYFIFLLSFSFIHLSPYLFDIFLVRFFN